MRQHTRAVPVGVPLERPDRGRRGAPDAHQEHPSALRGTGSRDPRGASLRTSGDHRGPIGGRLAPLSRMGRHGDAPPVNPPPRLLLAVLLTLLSPPPPP